MRGSRLKTNGNSSILSAIELLTKTIAKMKNSKQSFKKGYGKFPYIIERLRSGLYRQIPILFDSNESNKIELGLKFVFSKEQTEISREDLILIHKDSLVKYTKNYKNELEEKDLMDKRICLVLGPKKGVYFEPNNEIIESNSIPKGGWLLGVNNEKVTESELHYENHQLNNFNLIDPELLNFNIDEEKLKLISKEDPYRTFLFEKMWTPKRKNGINWMRKMIDKSENDN